MAAVLLATAGLLVFAGCGDDNSSSNPSIPNAGTATTLPKTRTITRHEERKIRRRRAKTIEKVNKVCRRINVNLSGDAVKLNAKDSPAVVQRRARQLSADYKAVARGLDQLGVAASQSRQDVGTGVKRASQMLEDASKALDQIQVAAQGQDLSQADKQFKRLRSDNIRYQATVRKYGFTGCY